MSPSSALLFSVLLGGVVAFAWTNLLDWLLSKELGAGPKKVWWLPVLTGGFERAIITTLVIWLPTTTITFIGGWMALKLAGGWGKLQEPDVRNRATYFAGLLGSVVSIGFAIWFGYCANPGAIGAIRDAA